MYFLKQKSDATKALEKFLCDVAPYGEINNMITRFRSDNGTEFTSKDFENVLIKHKIRHEFSAPYSPHQNGTAERNWRSLFEMARGMIIESNLPKSFWSYAIMTAAHLRNRVFCQRINDTPYHLLTGRKPSLRKLHIFGSICYAYTHNEKCKLNPRSNEGIFVGYDKYSPSYLVYLTGSNKVMKFGTVKFTEKFKLSKDLRKEQMIDFNTIFDTSPFYTNFDTAFDTDFNTALDTPFHNTHFDTSDHPNFSKPEGAISEKPLPNNNSNKSTSSNENHEDQCNENDDDNNHEGKEFTKRYPDRIREKPIYLKDYTNSLDMCYKLTDAPNSYSEAINRIDAEKWITAMQKEMESMKDNEVYELRELPKGKKVVGSRWVYTVKDNPNEEPVYKARFVAKGFSQVEGIDYLNTYSPTAKMTTVRMTIQYAVQNEMIIHQLDVKTAYLNAPIDCDVYISQPDGFTISDSDDRKIVWKLKKSLYGIKQSGRNWNIVLNNFFKS